MSIRTDILAAARGEMPERLPWTITYRLLPRGETERLLRTQGLGLVYPVQGLASESLEHPRVEVVQRSFRDRGKTFRRVHYRTPVGELTELWQPHSSSGLAGYLVDWQLEYMVKGPSDYEALEFIIRDQVCNFDNDAFVRAKDEIGNDGVVIGRVNRAPFQRLWIEHTGIERLSLDLADNRELVERVMQAMIETDQELWRLLAESPVDLVQCTDNISADIVGRGLFEEYFLPYYAALDDRMRPAGKLVFIHMDGWSLRALAPAIDRMPKGMIVEALTPPPGGDYTVAEARSDWKGRPIWINFPSVVHHAPLDEVEAATLEILRQAVPGEGFLFGITENMPAASWQQSMTAIGRVLERHGRCPIRL